PSTAGDLAQDAMIRVWKGLGAFDWRSSVQTWIFTVARNVYLNHRRHLQTKRAKAERDSLDALLEQTVDGKRAPPSGLTSRDLDPAARAEHAERVHLANASIDAMPKRMRQCFLARQADLSYGDIGRLYDVQPDTVKKHLRAGRQRLRSLFTVFAGLVSTLGWALRALERTGG
ncbi:MAG: sigma-70 family RNA polymerase sigma factor, partial [Acidobacteriota bacterium]